MTERQILVAGEKYRHFKNRSEYEIIVISRFEPTDEITASYKPLYFVEGKITNFTRTLENFLEVVEKKLSNGTPYHGPRFEKIE